MGLKAANMMSYGIKCHSSDTTKCLLREIPGVLNDKISLFSEINYLRYYRYEKRKSQKWYHDDMPKFLFREKIPIPGILDLEISLFEYIRLIKLRIQSFFS